MTVEQRLYKQLKMYQQNYPSCNVPLCNYCLWGFRDELEKFAKIVSKELGDYCGFNMRTKKHEYILSTSTRKKVVTYALQYLKKKGCVD